MLLTLLASSVLLSMDHEHGTDYLQHFIQQNLRYARSSISWKLTCSSSNLVLVAVMSCATVRRHCDCFIASLAPFINIQTYLLTYVDLPTPLFNKPSFQELFQAQLCIKHKTTTPSHITGGGFYKL